MICFTWNLEVTIGKWMCGIRSPSTQNILPSQSTSSLLPILGQWTDRCRHNLTPAGSSIILWISVSDGNWTDTMTLCKTCSDKILFHSDQRTHATLRQSKILLGGNCLSYIEYQEHLIANHLCLELSFDFRFPVPSKRIGSKRWTSDYSASFYAVSSQNQFRYCNDRRVCFTFIDSLTNQSNQFQVSASDSYQRQYFSRETVCIISETASSQRCRQS